jgi:hypothetical protein
MADAVKSRPTTQLEYVQLMTPFKSQRCPTLVDLVYRVEYSSGKLLGALSA